VGVLIDDLATMGTKEPYRMFTSRAEYRLLLREDNADIRLTAKGREIGLVDDARWQAFNEKLEVIELEKQRLKSTWVHPNHPAVEELNVLLKNPVTKENTLEDLIRRPEMTYQRLMEVASLGPKINHLQAAEQVEIQIKYAGYIERQKDEIARTLRNENTLIPMDFDFGQISGLSNEVVDKLSDTRPETIGKAARIPGVTPAAVSLLLIFLKKHGLLSASGEKSPRISA
jgi:tRNA uridine 5-carboxymethylaminomethyl modification enzyme